MAFIDNIDAIREKAAEAAQTAAKKTRKLAEIAKANVSIYSEEDKVKKAYMKLGKLYYRDYIVGEEMDEAEYLPWCRQIDVCKQTIADLQDYIETLRSEHVDMPREEASGVVQEKDTEQNEYMELPQGTDKTDAAVVGDSFSASEDADSL